MASDPTANPPLANAAIEDFLAHAQEGERAMFLSALMLVAAEMLARQAGRGACRDQLHQIDSFIREAQPMPPWRD